MRYQFKRAREEVGISQTELAAKVGVGKATVNNWETGKRNPSLENLLEISKTLGVGVEYLLGVKNEQVSWTQPIPLETLPTMHHAPVWSARNGWALVDAVKGVLVYADGRQISFEETKEQLYAIPPSFALSLRGIGEPLTLGEVLRCDAVWVEPILPDVDSRFELRGVYRLLHNSFVENAGGNRFFVDTYGAKWLAFQNNPLE